MEGQGVNVFTQDKLLAILATLKRPHKKNKTTLTGHKITLNGQPLFIRWLIFTNRHYQTIHSYGQFENLIHMKNRDMHVFGYGSETECPE